MLHIAAIVFISCNLNQIVPIHHWPYFILQTVGLLDLRVWSNDDPLVLDPLASLFSTVIQQSGASLLSLILANLALLNGLLLLLPNQTYIQLLCFKLSTLFNLLLVRNHQQFLRHVCLIDTLNVLRQLLL